MNELISIFKQLDEATQKNMEDFPYSDMQKTFNHKFKEYLKVKFGENIQFGRKETLAYVQAFYKGIPIEINMYDGIILTVEDASAMAIAADFEPIFTELMGLSQICNYNYCSKVSKTVYPTFEWNLHPKKRIYELVHGWNTSPGESMRDFNDMYNIGIIKELGLNLLTNEGYKRLFSPADDFDYINHVIGLIISQLHIDYNTIWEWIHLVEAIEKTKAANPVATIS